MNKKDKERQIATIPLEKKLQMLLQEIRMCKVFAKKLGFKADTDLVEALVDAEVELALFMENM